MATITGTSGNDGNDILKGNATEADTIFGDAGNDTLHGGAGSDTVSYASASTGVNVSLLNNTATGDGTDALIDIENITGSSNDDVLQGDGNNNSIIGGAGSDELRANDQIEIDVNSGNLISYGGGQDGGGTRTFLDDGVGVNLNGNNWEQILGTFTITANTILEFDFRATIEAEIINFSYSNQKTFPA